MKNETILNKLMKLKEKPYNTELLDGIINELKIDVFNENMGMKNRRNDPQKKALKFLNENKKRFPDSRRCLGYAYETTISGSDVQVFTDSYIAFVLKTHYTLPLWDDETEKSKYPQIERCLPNKNYGEVAEFSFRELAAKLKAKLLEERDGVKLIELKSESYTCWFDADNLKKISDILGTNDLTVRLYGKLKPALIIDEKTDNQAIICPIRECR